MVQEKVEVRLKTGLQARPAALFVQEANRFASCTNNAAGRACKPVFKRTSTFS